MITGSLITIIGFRVISPSMFAAVTSDPIQKLEDPITTWAVENIRPEYGAARASIFVLGILGWVSLVAQ